MGGPNPAGPILAVSIPSWVLKYPLKPTSPSLKYKQTKEKPLAQLHLIINIFENKGGSVLNKAFLGKHHQASMKKYQVHGFLGALLKMDCLFPPLSSFIMEK